MASPRYPAEFRNTWPGATGIDTQLNWGKWIVSSAVSKEEPVECPAGVSESLVAHSQIVLSLHPA